MYQTNDSMAKGNLMNWRTHRFTKFISAFIALNFLVFQVPLVPAADLTLLDTNGSSQLSPTVSATESATQTAATTSTTQTGEENTTTSFLQNQTSLSPATSTPTVDPLKTNIEPPSEPAPTAAAGVQVLVGEPEVIKPVESILPPVDLEKEQIEKAKAVLAKDLVTHFGLTQTMVDEWMKQGLIKINVDLANLKAVVSID